MTYLGFRSEISAAFYSPMKIHVDYIVLEFVTPTSTHRNLFNKFRLKQ